jgi:hypothetical protein
MLIYGNVIDSRWPKAFVGPRAIKIWLEILSTHVCTANLLLPQALIAFAVVVVLVYVLLYRCSDAIWGMYSSVRPSKAVMDAVIGHAFRIRDVMLMAVM